MLRFVSYLSVFPRIHDNTPIATKPPPNPTNESDATPSPVTARVNPTSPEQTGPVINLAACSTALKMKENKGKARATGTIDRR